MLYNSSLFRWLSRKRYQYEVTTSLYMLTPTEKFIFNSGLFLVLSLIIIAAALYLPEHVSTIARRASFYWAGDDVHMKHAVASERLAQVTARAISTATEAFAEGTAAAARINDEL